MDLPKAFKALRASRDMSLRDIGGKCDMSETTPWKIENGKPVRWETMHRILTNALKTQPGSDDYENLHRLWLLQRQQRAESAPAGQGRKSLSKHAAKSVYDYRRLVKGKKEAEVAKIFAGAKRAADRLERG